MLNRIFCLSCITCFTFTSWAQPGALDTAFGNNGLSTALPQHISFGNAGYLTTNLGSDADSGNALAIQPDGKILVAGITGDTRDFALLRYDMNGVLDQSFGIQGVVTTDFFGGDDYANAVLL